MRPCRQCRAPIENRVSVCPQCGAAQEVAPKPNADPPLPQSWRSFVRQFLGGFTDAGGLVLSVVPFALVFPLVLAAGAAGYLAAGPIGAAVGGVGAIALVLGVLIWAESGG